jgi:hypothetical protein
LTRINSNLWRAIIVTRLLQDEASQAKPPPVAIEDVTLHHHNDANAVCCSS